ncbi:O-antigen ligase family protein [Micromonospora craniellae]|uniref:O-antigen ligase domain-containing protein n=1 Tax=Micromonospora craniellae TaxID=2294034 RepID=A0A372FY44_9ACTN|nr:O-antigen ligase family protein [Micromonospora craniellae]QOC93249.1 O-antigen ligase family protein [Micromonospora craniellae]RFS45410.1 O-antigen ligase domain-containing protein [Micromonospora craniellae]
MTTLFGVLLSAAGLAVAGWLVYARQAVAASFGGASTAVALIGFAALANAAPVLAGDHSSALIGVLVFALVVWLLVVHRGRLAGPPEIWRRICLGLAGAVLVWCVGVDVLTGDGVYGSRLPAYAAAGLLLVAVWLLAAGAPVSLGAMAYTGLAVLSLLTIPTAVYGQAWRACTDGQLEKCSLAGGLFKSFYDSENYIALITSFTLVAAVCALRRAERWAVVTFCLLVIVATGSRTSYLALAAVGVWVLGAWMMEWRRPYQRIHFVLCVPLVVGAVAVATYLAWSASKTTLSNRGNIWIHAREYIAGSEGTGVGVSKWYYLRDIGEAPHHFFHSGYVLAIFSGGFVALTLWGLLLATLLRAPVVDGRAFSAKAPVALFVIYSFTEVVWNPLSVDGLTWIFVLMVLTGSALGSTGPVPVDATADPRPSALTRLRRMTGRPASGSAPTEARD